MLSSCIITRTEYDAYTITVRDTLVKERVQNVPGTDNGVVFPTSRTTRYYRETLSYDSTYERYYPAFLRYGGLEFAGLITGAAGPGVGASVLGVHTIADSNLIKNLIAPKENTIFKGKLFRIMPVEYRLRWFDDAPDWTIGWSLLESIQQNDSSVNTLTSYGANVYIRKRFWFRTKPPYLFAAPFVGLSLAPSLYVNLGGELDFGSFGGFNLRAYLGVARGTNWLDRDPRPITTFYTGLGVSALDFVNKVSETQQEWKDYQHSATEVSVAEIDILDAFAGYKNFFSKKTGLPFTGLSIQMATAQFPLGIVDGKFWVGTTLFKFFALGFEQSLFSVLPLRFGYRTYLLAEDLTLEPFIEANYYPSSFINLGARLKLNTFRDVTVGLIGGFAAGSTGAFYPRILTQEGSLVKSELSSLYLGISIGLKDRYNTPQHIKDLEQLHANE
jgi:hypothetical protein